MPDATITSTASTFGTISGVFSADQSTISGTISGIVPGTLTGSVGVPGPAGAPGVGVPAGGTSGQFLQKTSGVDYATDWVTVNLTGLATESWVTAGFYPLTGNPSGFLTAASLSGYATESWVTSQGYITSSALTPYLTKADNLGSLTNFATARSNLSLGTLDTPVFAGVTAQGSGLNVSNLTPTSLSLSHTTFGSFVISPSTGITFPDTSVQTTAFTTAQLTNYLAKASNLSDLTSASSARTNLGLGSLAVVNDAPSDGSQYARKNGAWDVVTTTPDYITSVSSPLSVTTGNLSIDLSAYAPLASPVFTGDARAVTPAFGDNDTSIATTAFVQAGLLGGTAVARNLEVEVRNQSGSTIAAGSIVYISGATGNKPLITLAQANNDANSAQTIGFVKTAIANNGTGYVIVRGELENIDTSALTEGVQLYLSPTTAGSWTTTKPSAPQHLVYVGIVIRSHPTQGTILVAVQNGYELHELHDVALSSEANNDLLAYESSTDLWKNKTYSALGLLTSSAAAATYAPIASPTFTGTVTIPAGASISGFAPLASPALTGNVTITSNSTGAALFIEQAGAGNILTLHDQASDTTFVAIDQNGKVNTIPSTTANAGLNIAHGVAPTTPVNGDIWTTTSGFFWRQNGFTKQAANLGDNQTFTNATLTFGNSTAAGTISVGSGATISGSTKTINIGTAGVAGSTTTVTIGSSVAGATSSITLNGVAIASASDTTRASLRIPHGSAPTTPTNGDLWTETTGIFVRINGASQQLVPFTALSTYAALGSPAFTGTPTAPTATVDTNTTQIATTAYVVGQAGSATPLVDGTAAVGTSLRYARQDHVHGTDTTRAPLASPTFTGTVTIPAGASISGFAPLASPAFTGTPSLPTGTTAVTQTAGNNTTAVATTAFVTAAVPAFATFTTPTPTSTTTSVPPRVAMDYLMHPGFLDWGVRGSTLTSGAGASIAASSTRIQYMIGPNALTAGYSMAVWDSATSSRGMLGMTRGVNVTQRAWNKPVWASGRGQLGDPDVTTFNGTADSVVRVSVGGKISGGSGDISVNEPGFGWYFIPGSAMVLQVSLGNGSALTNVTSSFTPVAKEVFDWKLYSDGAGNVTLYINDSQVATTTGGPSTGTAESFNFYFEMVEQTASATARILWTSINPKIYWGV
jgi:hypothetical protein